MYTCPIELTDVRYNAAEQTFEAAVTVHDNTIVRRYACAITAPITMGFEEAARGLTKQALRRHTTRGGLFSDLSGNPIAAPLRVTTQPAKRWLQRLIDLPMRAAA